MIVAVRIKLADARAELGITQKQLAASAKLSKTVIVNAEKGLAIRRLSAHSILQALNAVRHSRGMPSLTINDIDWHIDGA